VIATVPAIPAAAAGLLPKFILPSRSKIDWWNALPSAMLAVLIVALFNRGDFSALGLLLCSVLSVIFYRQRNRLVVITRWVGARIGAVAGVFATAIMFVSQWSQLKPHLQEINAQAIQQALARNTDPAARQFLQSFVSSYPNGLIILGIGSMVIAMVLVATVGGALSASWMKRLRPPVHMVSPDENKLEHPEKTEGSEHDR
jgi:hypothetical protein